MARPRTPIGAHGAISVVLLDDGSWRARTRFRFEDGRLRQVERFDTSGPKARRKLLAALTTIKATTSGTINQHTPLSRLADRYVENKRTSGVAPTTLAAYERTLSKIVLPALGELAVLEATPERLQRFMDQVIAKHGPASAKMCRAVLSGMLGLAVRNDAARTNAVRELERVSQRRDGAIALNAEQLQDLLTRADLDERVQALDLADLLRFMAGTGCRIGEACAMIWEDVSPVQSTSTRPLSGSGDRGYFARSTARRKDPIAESPSPSTSTRCSSAGPPIAGSGRWSSRPFSATSVTRTTPRLIGVVSASLSGSPASSCTPSGRRSRRSLTVPASRRATSRSTSGTRTRR